MKKWLVTLLAVSLLVLLAACGGSGDNESTGEDSEESANNTAEEAGNDDSTVNITATNWEFDQEEYTAPAGEVTVNLSSEEGYHGIEVENTDIEIESDGSATATLEPGEYTIRCNIPCGTGHNEMVATLIVQ
ncbi:Cytochrome C oxidase subunit II, periplasmic domain [Gracilibacillus ureilyticus]|uniref:Cytochrome C oxidase subunit II, periplasmic domain n=1 Tax=Gracilibacillus ureilyticus TaxID=531814 RepID=A0A1H9P4W7_9BACI|nr:cytochrome C oxidase subunit II [Gracilibacillus ureilyticus]SER43344.1 Cytochrome C oxidase subunit II, periplasmic domain [Gracilibacillus ureilyticus]